MERHTENLPTPTKVYEMRCSRLIAIGLVVLLTLTQGITVKAETTEEVLNIYGMTLGKPIRKDLEDKISELEHTKADITATQNVIEQRNAMIAQFNEKMNKRADAILSNVTIYQSRLDEITKNIQLNVEDGDIESLLRYDAEYKSNEYELNKLLETLGDYYIDYDYSFINSDLTEIEKELMDTQTLYIESIDTFEVGDVKNIIFPMPVDRYVTSKFGYRIDPLKKDIISYHSGTDYRCAVGTQVYALFNGEVVSCGWSETAGNFITVKSGDNLKYFVCHLSEILVEKGQQVSQYDTIGLSGATGSRCTGPHLHLAIYINGVAEDVEEIFKYAESQSD